MKSCVTNVFLIVVYIGAVAGIQRLVFRNLRKIPMIKKKVDEEIRKAEKVMKHDIKSLYQGDNAECIFVTNLPHKGASTEDILSRIKDYLELGKFNIRPAICLAFTFLGKVFSHCKINFY